MGVFFLEDFGQGGVSKNVLKGMQDGQEEFFFFGGGGGQSFSCKVLLEVYPEQIPQKCSRSTVNIYLTYNIYHQRIEGRCLGKYQFEALGRP